VVKMLADAAGAEDSADRRFLEELTHNSDSCSTGWLPAACTGAFDGGLPGRSGQRSCNDVGSRLRAGVIHRAVFGDAERARRCFHRQRVPPSLPKKRLLAPGSALSP